MKTLARVLVNTTGYADHPSVACINEDIGVALPIAKSGNYKIVAGPIEVTIFRRVSRLTINIKFTDILIISTYFVFCFVIIMIVILLFEML